MKTIAMARAIAARSQGDDYQARWFWIQACRLFAAYPKVIRVVYEANNVKSFDDVVVYFSNEITDDEGHPLTAEYFQVKFHVTSSGALTWESLMNPLFINASAVSLLQRLKNAQVQHASNGTEAHFVLYSPWPIHPDDPLANIHSQADGRLDWHRLNQGTTERSKFGQIRAAWRNHLNLETDEELRTVLRPLRIRQGRTLAEIGEALNDKLYRAGLKPVEEGMLCHPYDDLTRKLLQNGRTEFTRADIEKICRQEGLWMGHPVKPFDRYQVGFRSFLRWAENLEDETDTMLDLLRWFNGRNIRSNELWDEAVYPAIAAFLSKALNPNQQCDLHMHIHSSIAFAIGYYLDSKSGIDAAVIQSTRSGRDRWKPSPHPDAAKYPTWDTSEETMPSDGTHVAIALSVTHDITRDVHNYLTQTGSQVGRLITYTLPSGSSQQSVLDADHAYLLAQSLSMQLKANRTDTERGKPLHLFIAAPNALVFQIGQLSRSFGPLKLYEYDFDNAATGSYQPSFSFPPTR